MAAQPLAHAHPMLSAMFLSIEPDTTNSSRSATGASRRSICFWANRLAPVCCIGWFDSLLGKNNSVQALTALLGFQHQILRALQAVALLSCKHLGNNQTKTSQFVRRNVI